MTIISCDDSFGSDDTDRRHSSLDSSSQGTDNNNNNNNNSNTKINNTSTTAASGAGTNDAEQVNKACRHRTTRFSLESSTTDGGRSSLESSSSNNNNDNANANDNNNNNNNTHPDASASGPASGPASGTSMEHDSHIESSDTRETVGIRANFLAIRQIGRTIISSVSRPFDNTNGRESIESENSEVSYPELASSDQPRHNASYDKSIPLPNYQDKDSPTIYKPNMFDGNNNNNNNNNDNNNANANGNDDNNNNNNVHNPDASASGGTGIEEDEKGRSTTSNYTDGKENQHTPSPAATSVPSSSSSNSTKNTGTNHADITATPSTATNTSIPTSLPPSSNNNAGTNPGIDSDGDKDMLSSSGKNIGTTASSNSSSSSNSNNKRSQNFFQTTKQCPIIKTGDEDEDEDEDDEANNNNNSSKNRKHPQPPDSDDDHNLTLGGKKQKINGAPTTSPTATENPTEDYQCSPLSDQSTGSQTAVAAHGGKRRRSSDPDESTRSTKKMKLPKEKEEERERQETAAAAEGKNSGTTACNSNSNNYTIKSSRNSLSGTGSFLEAFPLSSPDDNTSTGNSKRRRLCDKSLNLPKSDNSPGRAAESSLILHNTSHQANDAARSISNTDKDNSANNYKENCTAVSSTPSEKECGAKLLVGDQINAPAPEPTAPTVTAKSQLNTKIYTETALVNVNASNNDLCGNVNVEHDRVNTISSSISGKAENEEEGRKSLSSTFPTVPLKRTVPQVASNQTNSNHLIVDTRNTEGKNEGAAVGANISSEVSVLSTGPSGQASGGGANFDGQNTSRDKNSVDNELSSSCNNSGLVIDSLFANDRNISNDKVNEKKTLSTSLSPQAVDDDPDGSKSSRQSTHNEQGNSSTLDSNDIDEEDDDDDKQKQQNEFDPDHQQAAKYAASATTATILEKLLASPSPASPPPEKKKKDAIVTSKKSSPSSSSIVGKDNRATSPGDSSTTSIAQSKGKNNNKDVDDVAGEHESTELHSDIHAGVGGRKNTAIVLATSSMPNTQKKKAAIASEISSPSPSPSPSLNSKKDTDTEAGKESSSSTPTEMSPLSVQTSATTKSLSPTSPSSEKSDDSTEVPIATSLSSADARKNESDSTLSQKMQYENDHITSGGDDTSNNDDGLGTAMFETSLSLEGAKDTTNEAVEEASESSPSSQIKLRVATMVAAAAAAKEEEEKKQQEAARDVQAKNTEEIARREAVTAAAAAAEEEEERKRVEAAAAAVVAKAKEEEEERERQEAKEKAAAAAEAARLVRVAEAQKAAQLAEEQRIQKEAAAEAAVAAETARIVRVAEEKEAARLVVEEKQRKQEEAAAEAARLVRVAKEKEAARLAAEKEQRKQEAKGETTRDDMESDTGEGGGDDADSEMENETSNDPLLKFLTVILPFLNKSFGELRQITNKKWKEKEKVPLESEDDDYVKVAFAFGEFVKSLGNNFNQLPDEASSNTLLDFLKIRAPIEENGDASINYLKSARGIIDVMFDVFRNTYIGPTSSAVPLPLNLNGHLIQVIGKWDEGKLEDCTKVTTLIKISYESRYALFPYLIKKHHRRFFEMESCLLLTSNGVFVKIMNVINKDVKDYGDSKKEYHILDPNNKSGQQLSSEEMEKYIKDHTCVIIMMIFKKTNKIPGGALTRSQTQGNRTETTTTVDSFVNDAAKDTRTKTSTTVDSVVNDVQCVPYSTLVALNAFDRCQENGKPFSLEVVSSQMTPTDNRGYHDIKCAQRVLKDNNLILVELTIDPGAHVLFLSLTTGIYMFFAGFYGEHGSTNVDVPEENRHMAVFNANTRMVLDQTDPFVLKAGVEKDKEMIRKTFKKKWKGIGQIKLTKYYYVTDMKNPIIPKEAVSLFKQSDIHPDIFPLITDQLRKWEQIRQVQLSKKTKPIKQQNIPRCKYCGYRHLEVCHLVDKFVSITKWEYKGLDKQLYGPHTTEQMLGWVEAGYFDGTERVPVRTVRMTDDSDNEQQQNQQPNDKAKNRSCTAIRGKWMWSNEVEYQKYL